MSKELSFCVNKTCFKVSWSLEEDKKLKELIKEYGFKWKEISKNMEGKDRKQCRERYVNCLDPGISNKPWTEAENQVIIQLQRSVGNKWSYISRKLIGRSPLGVKNHWHSQLKAIVEQKKIMVPQKNNFQEILHLEDDRIPNFFESPENDSNQFLFEEAFLPLSPFDPSSSFAETRSMSL